MTSHTPYPSTDDDTAFSPYAWPGGYPIAYYPLQNPGDEPGSDLVGDTLCADCARKEWQKDNRARFYPQIEEEALERDVMCDNCHTIIAPQQCRLCFDSIHEPPFGDHTNPLPLFRSDEGYGAHGKCLAQAVADGEYRKTGKQAYAQVSCIGRFYLPPFTAEGSR